MKTRISKHYKTKEVIRIKKWDDKGRLVWDEQPQHNSWWKTEYVEKDNTIIAYHTSSTGYKETEVIN